MDLVYKIHGPSEIISEEDLYLVSKLDHFEFPNPWPLESWKNYVQSQPYFMLILEVESFKCFCLFQTSYADSFAHLLKILVPNKLRGRKFGSLLLEKAMFELSKKNVTKFFLEVEEENYAAIALYQKHGFKIIHKKKNFYGTDKHALIMTHGET